MTEIKTKPKRKWDGVIVSLSLTTILGLGYLGIKYETDRMHAQMESVEKETEKLYRRERALTEQHREQLEKEKAQVYTQMEKKLGEIRTGVKGIEESVARAERNELDLKHEVKLLEEERKKYEERLREKLQSIRNDIETVQGSAQKREEAIRIVEEDLRAYRRTTEESVNNIVCDVNRIIRNDGLYIFNGIGHPSIQTIVYSSKQGNDPRSDNRELILVETKNRDEVDRMSRLPLEQILCTINHTQRDGNGVLAYSLDMLQAIKKRVDGYTDKKEALISLMEVVLNDPAHLPGNDRMVPEQYPLASLIEYAARNAMEIEKRRADITGKELRMEEIIFQAAEMKCGYVEHRRRAEEMVSSIFNYIDSQRELGLGLYPTITPGPLYDRVAGLAPLGRGGLIKIDEEMKRKQTKQDDKNNK